MRSSKKRSRSNQNRPRSLGNIVNRVFDSSGPEGKVRGTPQQIIEKYQMLARDAQLSNDRVAAENFLQHAEHYTRMLAEAMKEMAAEQEARQQQYQQNGGQQGGQGGQQGGQQHQPRGDRPDRGDRQDRGERGDRGDRGERRDYNRDFRAERDLGSEEQPVIAEVIELDAGDDTGLIETPESSVRARAEVAPEPVAEAAPREDRPARRPRGPRKPKGEGKPDGEPPQEAAE
jgi:hypothetical protein